MTPTPLKTTAMIGLLVAGLSGCGYNAYSVKGINASLDELGRCSLLLDAEIQIWTYFDGAVLPDVSGSAMVSAAALELFTKGFEARFARQLRLARQPPANRELLDEYLALYSLVTDQALLLSGSYDPRWQHLQGRTDLGVGPELHAAAGVTLCGSAIVLNGFQPPASGTDVFPGAPVDRALLTLGLLDLDSGEIIWVNRIILPAGRDLMQGDHLRIAIDRVLKGFPA